MVVATLSMGVIITPTYAQSTTQPYQINEIEVEIAPNFQTDPVISGDWVAWAESGLSVPRTVHGKNITSAATFAVEPNGSVVSFDLDKEWLVTSESPDGTQIEVVAYRLPRLEQRTVIAAATETMRTDVNVSGNRVVWKEFQEGNYDILLYDLTTEESITIVGNPANQEHPALDGNIVVWMDSRNATSDGAYDLYAYNLADAREFRITAQPEQIGAPAIAGDIVAWWRRRGETVQVVAYNLATNQLTVLADLGTGTSGRVDVNTTIVVWSATQIGDADIFGYDLTQGKSFIISRAIGNQAQPSVSGNRVVWQDGRNGGAGQYEGESDLYGATLTAGAGEIPPVVGAPSAVDAKIQIVWPQGQPVEQATRANVTAWLYQPDTLNLTRCQWNPSVTLWQSVNSASAAPVGTGVKDGSLYFVANRPIPSWLFNDIDVSAARDPNTTLYFFVMTKGVPSHSNVWAHGANTLTNFPQVTVPDGISPVGGAVDARIQIVFPQDNLPVTEAQRVNVTAMAFAPGTNRSVPPEWRPTVRLWQGLNQNVLKEVATGRVRILEENGIQYPVWDFNDIDVAEARDPANKYFFMVTVDGVTTNPNVWVHGADARTNFPQVDVPTAPCS